VYRIHILMISLKPFLFYYFNFRFEAPPWTRDASDILLSTWIYTLLITDNGTDY
jgi:hypothetical protein